MTKELAKINDEANWVINTPDDIVNVVAGVLTHTKSENILVGARVIKNMIRGKGFSAFHDELIRLKEQGKVKSEFQESEIDDQLSDMLNILDSEDVDIKKREAAQKIFFRAIHPDVTVEQQFLSHQLLRILSKLSSLELMILQACYEIVNGKVKPSIIIDEHVSNYDNWAQVVVTQAGLQIRSFESLVDDNLVNMKLINDRTGADLSRANIGSQFRLTDLGFKLCEWVFEAN